MFRYRTGTQGSCNQQQTDKTEFAIIHTLGSVRPVIHFPVKDTEFKFYSDLVPKDKIKNKTLFRQALKIKNEHSR
jgi:hypothetical protein